MKSSAEDQSRQGVIYGVLSYGAWGIVPLYFKLVQHVPPPEVLAQRVVWSFVLLTGIITAVRRWPDVLPALRNHRVMLALTTSTLLLAFNWFIFIYAVSTNQVVEASLGYFLNPLVNVVIGVVVLKEHLRPWQIVSIVLAATGIAILGVPWIAVSLALSFGFYGLLRKQVAVDGLLGLFVETLLLTPMALLFVAYLQANGTSKFVMSDPSTCLRLMASGAVTAIPLLLFAAAARRLRFSTLGFLQYLAPTIQFILAVTLFDEPLSDTKVIALCFIWVAIGLYFTDSLRMLARDRSKRLEAELVPEPMDV